MDSPEPVQRPSCSLGDPAFFFQSKIASLVSVISAAFLPTGRRPGQKLGPFVSCEDTFQKLHTSLLLCPFNYNRATGPQIAVREVGKCPSWRWLCAQSKMRDSVTLKEGKNQYCRASGSRATKSQWIMQCEHTFGNSLFNIVCKNIILLQFNIYYRLTKFFDIMMVSDFYCQVNFLTR